MEAKSAIETDDWLAEAHMMAEEISHYVERPEVLALLRTTPRHRFLPPSMRGHAYCCHNVAIGAGQTATHPGIVAKMLDLLLSEMDAPRNRVLEIGTGSGYQTALLSHLFGSVYSVERIKSLYALAKEALADYPNVALRHSDGRLGWPFGNDERPLDFDAIIVCCAVPLHEFDELPAFVRQSTREGGCIVMPVEFPGGEQFLLVQRCHGTLDQQNYCGRIQFVPMIGGTAPC